MKQFAFQTFNQTWLPITGLIIFLVCFIIFVYWTYKKSNKHVYDQASMLPLGEIKNERRN